MRIKNVTLNSLKSGFLLTHNSVLCGKIFKSLRIFSQSVKFIEDIMFYHRKFSRSRLISSLAEIFVFIYAFSDTYIKVHL